jgi:GT2 family glycosyltransferase
MDNQTVAAVIVTYNRLELLKQCVGSLHNQTKKLDKIIVVNNSSTDGTLKWLEDQTDLTVITQDNSGSAGGQYTGIKYAYEKNYDWVWCLEDEIICHNDCLWKLFHFKEQVTEDIFIVSPIRINDSTQSIVNSEIININLSSIRNSKRFKRIQDNPNQYEKIIAPSFEGLLIHKKVIEKVGFPNKNFFIWYDDVEYGMRISQYFPIFIYKQAIVKKFSEENSKSKISQYNKMLYGTRNLMYIERKYFKTMGFKRLLQRISIALLLLNLVRFYIKHHNSLNGISIIKSFHFIKKPFLIDD